MRRLIGIAVLLGVFTLSLAIAGCGTAALSPTYLAHSTDAVNFVQCVANGNSLTGSLSFVLLPSGAKTVQTFNIPFTGTRSGSQLSLTLHGGNGLTTSETTIGGMNMAGLTVTGSLVGSDLTLNLPGVKGTLQTVRLVPASVESYNSAVTALQRQGAQTSAAAQEVQQQATPTASAPASAPVVKSTPSGAENLVPAAEQTRMKTLLSPYAYLPTSLPRGYIYIDWKYSSLSPSVAGQLLTINFAASGGDQQIIWTSSRACDSNGNIGPNATGWLGYGYGMTVNESASIGGHLVYFSQGNHGSRAWTGFAIGTSAQPDYVAVGIWESNFISPAEAMQIVARTRPA